MFAPQSEPLARRSSDQVIRWVLVRVCRNQSLGLCNFENGVDADTSVGVEWCAPSILQFHWEISGVDATGEELVGVVVNGLGVHNWYR